MARVNSKTPRPTNKVIVLVHDQRFKKLAATAKKSALAALAHEKSKKSAVTVVLTSDAKIRRLNHDYRGFDKPTNVLSFPDGSQDGAITQLGDVVPAYATIAAEAKAQAKPVADHVSHLVVHGVLHLLGHDHEKAKEAAAMESREIAILARMGIANPYAAY